MKVGRQLLRGKVRLGLKVVRTIRWATVTATPPRIVNNSRGVLPSCGHVPGSRR